MNYSIVPFKTFYCTQNYNDLPTHYKQSQSTNGVKAYPIDVVDDIYCGCDEMKVVKINGVGNGTVNQIFVQSTQKVKMPMGDYFLTYLITHPTDADINANLFIGKTFKRKDLIIHKGTDGGVGAHIDLVIAKSQQASWVLTSFGEYVLPDSIKPEDGMYSDDTFTNITNANGVVFKSIPKEIKVPSPVPRDDQRDQVEVICSINTLYVRIGAGLNNANIGFAIPGVYNIISTVTADSFTWYQVEAGKWFANAVACTQELPKKIIEDEKTTPIGSQIIMLKSKVPSNYLICDGREVSRGVYKDLFNVIGTEYGAGNGSTTFNLPNSIFVIINKDTNVIKFSNKITK